ncbi:hypothetical protein [Marinobacter sp. PE14]
MSFGQKLMHEIREVAVTTLYFAVWIGVLMVLKVLILAEYQIEFKGLSLVLLGAMILAKVVLVLEHVPLGSLTRRQPAWVDVLLRTALYSLGVFVVLVLEKAYEGRHEHGGFGPSLTSLFQRADVAHVWANAIALCGALLVYNCFYVVKRRLGAGEIARLFLLPVPEEPRAAGLSAKPRAD